MSFTTNLNLFKHDNPEQNEDLFDVTKSLNENWDKIDQYVYEQESIRNANEEIRKENEQNRETNERIRQEDEQDRENNEKVRKEAEENRVANEETRKTAETEREEYITELKERVDNGEFNGEPNVLSIGEVINGDEASATIEGDSPNQKLNLVLPKGEDGAKGEQGEKGTGIQDILLKEGTHLAGTMDTYIINYTDGTSTEFQVYNGADGEGSGDMEKSVYDTDDDGVVEEADHCESADNALKVNNHTIEKDVPSNAVFTDTTYENATTTTAGLMSSEDKEILDKLKEDNNWKEF